MQKVIVCCGIPASGKSFWARAEVAKDPNNWARINNDSIREMFNGSKWTADYEKLITNARNLLIKESLLMGKNIIIDNVNLNRRNFDVIIKIAKSTRRDIIVLEKPFYIELEQAIARDFQREGSAKVGEEIVKKWWKACGGKQFKFYNPRVEIIAAKNNGAINQYVANEALDKAILVDIDGTISLPNGRNIFDASTCDKDLPNKPVIDCVKAMYSSGHRIIFITGRDAKYRTQTESFIAKYFPDFEYELYMRPENDSRKDTIVKSELFNANIRARFNIIFALEDRDQVVSYYRHQLGLTVLQVCDGNY